MKRAKHFNGKMIFFGKASYGKHAKNEIVVYNPLYAKISSCLGSFAVATSLLTCVTLGKYKGTLASSDTARVAKYYVELKGDETSITEVLPETTQNIEFEVKNYQGELENITSRSEVDLKYRIIIGKDVDFIKDAGIIIETPVDGNLPLDYKLYRISTGNVEEEVTLVGGETDYINVGLSATSHKYRLKLIWQDGKDAILYQNLTDDFKIIIDSEQKD